MEPNDGSEAIGTTEPRLEPWFCCNGRRGGGDGVCGGGGDGGGGAPTEDVFTGVCVHVGG